MTLVQSNCIWKLLKDVSSITSTEYFAVETILPPPEKGHTELSIDIHEVSVKHPNGHVYGMSFTSFNFSPPGPKNPKFESMVSSIYKKLKTMLSADYPTTGVSYANKMKVQQSFEIIRTKNTIYLPYLTKRKLYFWFLLNGTSVFDYVLYKTDKAIEQEINTSLFKQYTVCQIMWIFNQPFSKVVEQLKWLSKNLPDYFLYRRSITYEDFNTNQIMYKHTCYWLPKHGTVTYSNNEKTKEKALFISNYLYLMLKLKSESEEPLPFLEFNIIKKIVNKLTSDVISKMFNSFSINDIKTIMKYVYQNDSSLQVFLFKALINLPVAFYEKNENDKFNQYIKTKEVDDKTNYIFRNYNPQRLILIKKSNFI
jgi:hypothetical protein